MAGFGLCDRLVRAGTVDEFEITLIGDEPSPAYDRVNLSRYFSGASADDLLLAPQEWYENHGIALRTSARVVRIDREAKTVFEASGTAHAYDKLVLATGSHAFVPPIEGHDCEGVFVYRTINDLQSIREYCESISAKRGAVVGGGLLGLEAAKIMMDLGLSVSVIEMAPGLMPRQFGCRRITAFEKKIRGMGVDLQLVRRTESIERTARGLRIHFANAEDLAVDLLIVAAGVRPNDQIADDAGLEIGPRRGIVIDETLQTSDPNIFAIGECASFNDHVFGLVAPCYRMSDVLASRLGGRKASFEGADESAELKLLGVQVATLGKTLGESPGGQIISYEDESGYRRLLIEKGRIVGASCVGPWEELPQVRQAINKQSRLWPWQRNRFERTGTPWAPGGALPVVQWPADAIVCSCLSVRKSTITELVAGGNDTPDSIANACGASTACGSCRSLLCELSGSAGETKAVPWATTMLTSSVLATVAVASWLFIGPIPVAQTVQSTWHSVESLLQSDVGRQVSGFSLLGLTLIGLLFSLRKRFDWFKLGSYGFWRAAHGVLRTLVVFGLIAHTGLRLGSNLNFLLGLTFLSAAFVGGLAGIVSSLESRTTGSLSMLTRLWRPRLTQLHLWVTWPLPVLIILHILSFYWFSD